MPVELDSATLIAVLRECRATFLTSRPGFLAYDARCVLARLGYDANDGEALADLEAWAVRFDGELEHPEIVSEFTTFREGVADILRTVHRCFENNEGVRVPHARLPRVLAEVAMSGFDLPS